jgi:hypothetical protein
LNGYPSYPYIREYNHYETDYVLQVSDMLGACMFPDNVSIAGYPLDLQGISVNEALPAASRSHVRIHMYSKKDGLSAVLSPAISAV